MLLERLTELGLSSVGSLTILKSHTDGRYVSYG